VYDPHEEPLAWIVQLWQNVLHRSHEIKQEVFQRDANEAMRFYGGRHDFVYQEGLPEGIPPPAFTMTVNRVADLVARYGPLLYHTNPNRRATPREIVAIPPQFWSSPQEFESIAQSEQARQQLDALKGGVMEAYLNWTPGVCDLRSHSRRAIDEALIKGRGVLTTALYQPPGVSFRVASSFFKSVDELLIDPDAESLEHATWAALWCVHPTWAVEREYGLHPGSLRGRYESHNWQAISRYSERGQYDRQMGISGDLIGYWKVYSKMGLGTRLKGSQGASGHPLDVFGDNVFLVIAPGVSYPLNLPPQVHQMPGATSDPNVYRNILQRISWPIPTWVSGQWPFAVLDFRPVPRRIWPMSPVQPGLGELRALDWIYSFIVSRIKKSHRDILLYTADLDESIVRTIIAGQDLEMVKVPPRQGVKDLKELVNTLSFPEIKGEVVQVLRILQDQFNERVGLNELETGTQIRSASEADYRVAHMQLRSDDFAEIVEAWQSTAARLEAFAARCLLAPQDVAPALGQAAALFWMRFLASPDMNAIATDLEYHLESGSIRKPDRARELSTMNDAMQAIGPQLFSYGTGTGDFGPFNNLLGRWSRARGESPGGLLLQPPPPPPGAGPPARSPNGPGR
jgi:hypothetical protein